MRTLKDKQLDFLNDTVNHFNSNNRAVDEEGACLYSTGCAIGRNLPKDVCEKLDRLDNPGIGCTPTFELLPKEIKDLGQFFLHSIQYLHDSERYWSESGLSELGKEKVEIIKLKFNLNQTK